MQASAHTICFERAVFELDTVKRAAYRLSSRASFDFSQTDSQITCVLTPAANSADGIDCLIADFKSEVLDQDLRTRIREETAAIRNSILALAFAPIRRE
jgi:His-Xaa-Ser system protein HxsD